MLAVVFAVAVPGVRAAAQSAPLAAIARDSLPVVSLFDDASAGSRSLEFEPVQDVRKDRDIRAGAADIDLSITKSHPAAGFVGTKTGTYTFVVANVGTLATSSAITVVDNLPAALTYKSASGAGWSCSAVGQAVTCTSNGVLNPGQSTSFTIDVNVGLSAVPGVINTASVSTPGENPALLGNNTSSDPTSVRTPDPYVDLALQKSHSGNLVIGQNATYKLVVSNIGLRTTAPSISVTDNLPNGLTFVSGGGLGWTCGAVGQLVTCTSTTPLAPGTTTSIGLVVAVGAAAFPSVSNTATVTTPNEPPPLLNNNTSTDPANVDRPVPDLAIVKAAVGAFNVGANGTFSLTVSNVSLFPTTGTTTVSDLLPSGLSYVSATGAGWSCSATGATVTCTNAAPMAAGASSVITLTVGVGAAAVPSVTNTAVVSTPGDSNPNNNTSTTTVPVGFTLDVGIVKSHSGNFTVGQQGTFTLAVTNTGNVPTSGTISVSDNLPAGLTYVSATGSGWACTANGAAVSCNTPQQLAVGASSAITLKVAVGAAAAPTVVNTAIVTMPGDAVPGNNTSSDPVTVIVPPPDLSIVKTATTSFVVGQQASYTLAVANVSVTPTSGTTTITDVLPSGLTFVSAAGAGWSCSPSGATVTCANPSPIAGGASAGVITLTVAVSPPAAPSVTNTATVSTPGDSNPANNTSTVTTPVSSTLDLAIVKSHSGIFNVGQSNSYQLTVSNVGNMPTTGTTTVTDNLPTGLAYVSATGAGWSCSAAGALVTCTTSTIFNPGASSTITLTVAIGAAAAPSVTNVARVATPGDQVPGNNTSSDITPVVDPGSPDLAIVKRAVGGFTAGQNGTFELSVTNVSPRAATGTTTVTDVLPTGLSFVSANGPAWACSAAGATVTCTTQTIISSGGASVISLVVAVANNAPSTMTNTGVVKTPGDKNPANDSSSTTVSLGGGPPALDLEIIKTAGPMKKDSTGTFTLAVKNVSQVLNTQAIVVTDNLPVGLTFLSGSGPGFTCAASGQLVTCTRPTALLPLQTALITIDVHVGLNVASPFTNIGAVRTFGDNDFQNDTSKVTVTPSGPTVLDPDLAMKKELVGNSAVAGQQVSFNLTVTNVGKGPTRGVITVTDTLNSALTFVSGTGAGWSCSALGQVVTCVNPGPLAPNATTSIRLVTQSSPALLPFENTAIVKTPGDGNPTNDPSTISVPTTSAQTIDLRTDKTASGTTFNVGVAGSYTIRVTNVGNLATIQPIVITDVVPASLSIVSASGAGSTCAIAGQTITCTNPGPLAGGASLEITVNVIPLAAAVPTVRNTASSTTPGDNNPGNDSSTVETGVSGAVDLTLSKVAATTFKVGAQGHYTLTVRNNGTIPASAPITVKDTLPAGLSFVTALGTGWTCSAAGGVVTCARSTALGPNESSAIDLTVGITDAARPSVTNCASVSGANESASSLGNNSGCDTTPVAGEPNLQLTKSVSRTEAEIGDVIDYTVVVRNTGTADLADARVSDKLPVGFAYESHTARVNGSSIPDPTGAPGPTLQFSIGAVRVGQPVTLTYRVRITSGAQNGNNTNVAVASSTDGTKQSAPGSATTKIRGGLFEERGAIVGKVYVQCNCSNALQGSGEVGIPGVRVYMEDGTSAVTDVEGKYSFYNIAARMHVVKIDRASLPKGAVMVALSNRNAMDGYSRFADVKVGELYKADFAEGSGKADVLRLVLQRRRAGEVENAGTQISDNGRVPNAAASATGDSIHVPYATKVEGVMVSQDSVSGPMRTDKTYRPLVGAQRMMTDANSQLPITPLRAMEAQKGRNPMGYGRIELVVPQEGIPADGQSLVTITVRALDAAGKPLSGRVPATLEASLGRWLGEDVGRTEEGRQVILDGGSGTYTLIAAAQPGRGEVRVTTPDGSQTLPIVFVPAARPLMALGLLNARIDFRSLIKGGNALSSSADGFEESLRSWTFDNDSGKTRGGARGALLIKGRVFKDQLLTLSYDSERDRGRTLFRDIQAEQFFPIYGDASLREFDAQSRRKFYARLDRGASYTMFGDFQTTRADDRRLLTAYDRTLNGAVEHIEGSKGSATFFASQGRIRQAVDELPGRGISGPYVLTHAQGLVNSERVEIITRDRNQPSVILSRVVLTRFADYTIEAVSGRLIFRVPVPSADANLNPVSIRVSYETESANADKFWVYGGDASVRVSDAVEIGGTYAQDENPLQKTRIAGVNASARLTPGTVVMGEYAQSKDGGQTGDAYRVELRHQSARTEGRLFAIRSDSAFSNQSSTFFGGRTEVGGRFTQTLDEKTRLIGDALHTANNTANAGKRDGALLSVERDLNKAWRAELGYRYAKESGDYTPYPNATPIQRGLVDKDVSALRGRLNWTLPEKTRSSLFAEYEQDLRDASHRGAVGGEYIIANRARLYGRHEWLTSDQGAYALNTDNKQQYTVFGVDADYFRNTQMFSEYRARDAFAGRDAEASIGLRNRWAAAPGLLFNTSFERVAPLYTLPGMGINSSAGDALAVTGGVEWTRPSLWKSTARLEYRDAKSGNNFLASLGYARKLTRDWTFLGRTLWDVYDASQNETHGYSQVGFAWRQTDTNKWNALLRYENRLTHFGALGVSPQTQNNANILAALLNYQPVNRVTFSGRYAAKFASDKLGALNTKTNAQLFMGRGIFDLNRRLDVGVISSLLASDGFSARRYGLGAELGLILAKNLRVAAGYNLFGFTDKDLNTFGTTRKGAYIDLGFKFDESLFGFGGPNEPCENACKAGGKPEE